ncbi:cell division protein FtsQ (plasmid) [Niallia taxi]|uniref:cell division protein FtsQ n=1 Tax=Niallia taxi TaxID=2499688 RepID=UPI0012484D83|nr:cell division protein FtsQ [Niallia taxi]MDK8643639.1 cell division protein FtsQ [Niallia taxi]MED4036285.1 cell division protein FtsQ [Niallia taxi]MED4055988.1 cell division protein FtsQ [Niallia taxi]MED4120974.1 cell division protein FtsQ [Niallia taxi]
MKRNYTLTQSQKMMVFILSMSLYGLSNMITELVPSIYLGPVEFSIEYFAFIPLTLCILFHPLYAGIGAALGEVIFGEIMLGQFGGFGELEKFISFSLAMYIAGSMVKDPRNKRQVGIAAMAGVVIHQLISMMVDIGKVWVGVDDFEALPGLAESVVVVEGFSFLNDVLFSGILFALLPTLYLVPRLYGKIEPLLGMKPRTPDNAYAIRGILHPRFLIPVILLAVAAFGFEYLSETEWNIFEWEATFSNISESTLTLISLCVAAVVSATIIYVLIKRSKKERKKAA